MKTSTNIITLILSVAILVVAGQSNAGAEFPSCDSGFYDKYVDEYNGLLAVIPLQKKMIRGIRHASEAYQHTFDSQLDAYEDNLFRFGFLNGVLKFSECIEFENEE